MKNTNSLQQEEEENQQENAEDPHSVRKRTVNALEISSGDPFDDSQDSSTNAGYDDDVFTDNDIGDFTGAKNDTNNIHTIFSSLFTWGMVASSILSLIPFYHVIQTIMELTDRWYFCAIPAALQFLEKIFVYVLFQRIQIKHPHDYDSLPHQSWSMSMHLDDENEGTWSSPTSARTATTHVILTHCRTKLCSFCAKIRFVIELMVLIFMATVYLKIIPSFITSFVNGFWTDVDGTPYTDFSDAGDYFADIALYSIICGGLYSMSALCGIVALVSYYWNWNYSANDQEALDSRQRFSPASSLDLNLNPDSDTSCNRVHTFLRSCFRAGTLLRIIRYIHGMGCAISSIILLLSLQSAYTYLIDHPVPEGSNIGPHCDPMDTTECMLPFPSSFFTIGDGTTQTGQRVNIPREALSSMYKGPSTHNPKEPIHILNDLDGFSTSAPILFYLDGFKEGNNEESLIGHEDIDSSVTNQSMTLLLDMDSKELVHHFAEMDHLDEERPLIIIQPSQSLHHSTRYAVILINARDVDGGMLPMSDHLRWILAYDGKDNDNDKVEGEEGQYTLSPAEIKRGRYYRDTVLPLLYQVAPWVNNASLQMLFDFQTMSVNCQLGDTLMVVASAYQYVQPNQKQKQQSYPVPSSKKKTKKALKLIDRYNNHQCEQTGDALGSVIHGEVHVPSFLLRYHERVNELDMDAVIHGKPVIADEPFKFVIMIPCSIATGAMSVRAIVDYGHGFLYSRQELLDSGYLHR